MMYHLEMPDSFPGPGIERDQRVGEQVIAHTVAAIEIERRRAGGQEDHASFLVNAQSTPIIGSTGALIGVTRPCLVAELARMRDGVKDPLLLACDDVEGADVTGRGGSGAFASR